MRESSRNTRLRDVLIPFGVLPIFVLVAHEVNAYPFDDDSVNDPIVDDVVIEFTAYKSDMDPELRSQYQQFIIDEFEEAADFWDNDDVALDLDLTLGSEDTCGIINDAFFCPNNNTIYFSPDTLDYYAQSAGDLSPVMVAELVVRHEFGHAIQLAQSEGSGYTYSNSMALELQADCLAGNAMTEHRDEDMEGVEDLFLKVLGDKTPGKNSHGTGDERFAAFEYGLQSDCPALGDVLSTVSDALNNP